jgi:two-component sensor histidine kinase
MMSAAELAVPACIKAWTDFDDRIRPRPAETVESIPQGVAEGLYGRAASIAATWDLVLRSGSKGIVMGDLVRRRLGKFRQLIGSRVAATGPALTLKPLAAQLIGMAIYELVSNARKYGALSTESGTVTIAWNATCDRSEPLFIMKWCETGGPRVTAPGRAGFGQRLLRDLIEESLEADTHLAYRPSGLAWRLTAPAGEMLKR